MYICMCIYVCVYIYKYVYINLWQPNSGETIDNARPWHLCGACVSV